MRKTHGRSNDPLYQTHRNMLARCYNNSCKDYPDYGGRGISVCDRWQEPEGWGLLNFLEDMGERPVGLSLDRVDNDAGYSKENCRWATPQQQSVNKRSYRACGELPVGVLPSKTAGKYVAQMSVNGKMRHIGTYASIAEAEEAARKGRETHSP